MIRASDLIGCELHTESGDRLGRVHDLRAERAHDRWRVSGLILGRRGMAARLVGTRTDPLIRGEVIGWDTVIRLEPGLIIVRDGTIATR